MLRSFARFSAAAAGNAGGGVAKRTTGITGLDVVPNSREVLLSLYEKTLNDVKIIPEHVFYRQMVESTTKYRMEVVQSSTDLEKIEEEIGAGQMEELIDQGAMCVTGTYPWGVCRCLAAWRWWEEPPPEPDDDDYHELYEGLQEVDEGKLAAMGIRFNEDLLGRVDVHATDEQIREHMARIEELKNPKKPEDGKTER